MIKRLKILSFLLALAFIVVLAGIAQQKAEDTAKDPVCGMSVKLAGAKYTYDYMGTTYYFCSEGCKTAFSKEPDKYLAKKDVTKPMGQGMPMGGGMHGQQMQMKPGEKMGGAMENCPMMMKDLEKKFENTKDGVVITLTSKNPETVKKIQEHAAMMKEGKCPMMGKGGDVAKTGTGEEGCPMAKDCPMKKK
jgi:YHS domain-containing protein/TusA-related sulfurtransferase